MRLLCLLLLVVIIGAVVAFATQNLQPVTLDLFNFKLTSSVAVVIGATYLLGMFSGWTVIGLLRRSFERATDFGDSRQQQTAAR
jgi:hypothetical protein